MSSQDLGLSVATQIIIVWTIITTIIILSAIGACWYSSVMCFMDMKVNPAPLDGGKDDTASPGISMRSHTPILTGASHQPNAFQEDTLNNRALR